MERDLMKCELCFKVWSQNPPFYTTINDWPLYNDVLAQRLEGCTLQNNTLT